MAFTNAQLAQSISDMIDHWSGFAEEYANWLGGTASGGPSSDGLYPLTDWLGVQSLVKCPAKLQADVDGQVSSAAASATAAAASAAAASTDAATATTQAGLADTARIAAEAAQTAAETAESGATNEAATALAQANLANDRAGYAQEWAITVEDTLVSVAAGGDGASDYSALHHAAKAAASASGASTSASNASTSESNAATSATNASNSKDYSAEWANKAEDVLISAAAGGDQVDDYSALHWANKAAASAASIGDLDSLSDVVITTPAVKHAVMYNGSNFVNRLLVEADISDLQSYSLSSHNHSGVYEPVFSKNTGFNKNFGTAAGTVSEGNHNHSGVYEPADATIVKATITAIAAGELLKWDGTKWINNTLAEAGIEPAFSKNTGFNKNLGTAAGTVSEGDHNHSGVYEPAFTKNTGFNKNLGTAAGTVSEGNHNHSGVYEPASSNLTKDNVAETISAAWNFTAAPTKSALGIPYYVSTGYTGGKISVQTTAPSSPTKGDIWFDTT